ncbi:4070_t:CDS:2, partial [Racocetra persica]
GSRVMEGVGNYVVIGVGANSCRGRWLSLNTDSEDTSLQALNTDSKLQAKLNNLTEQIAKLGCAAALLMLIVLLIKYFISFRTNGAPSAPEAIDNLVRIIISAVTVVVVAVPGGLPLAVTLALAYATTRMLRDNNLGEPKNGKINFIGSKTETALLQLLLDLGVNYKILKDDAKIVQFYPFSSERKAMGLVVKEDSYFRFYVKGASEMLLQKTRSIIDTNSGDETELTDQERDNTQQVIRYYASRSLRTLAIAYRDLEQWPPDGITLDPEGEIKFEDLMLNITLLCIVGIEDPLREGVRQAVADCKDAGVKVRMVTGDNVLTAKSIAEQCGIYTTGGLVMEGPEFRNLPPEKMKEILSRLQVLARSSPEDKKILVGKLKEELNDTVAVTGDGTNDGPALRTADVGFSMGISGTEAAKEASSIILMDDNFSSIVKAIMWGRCVNDAIKKFLQFQLTVNVTAVLLTFISAVSSDQQKSVLSVVQLLWVNLIMDTFAALALATDPPTKELLKRKPGNRDAPLITPQMWKMIIGQSIFQLAITLILLYAADNIVGHRLDSETLATIVFNTFVMLQIFNEIKTPTFCDDESVVSNWQRQLKVFKALRGGGRFRTNFGTVNKNQQAPSLIVTAVGVLSSSVRNRSQDEVLQRSITGLIPAPRQKTD